MTTPQPLANSVEDPVRRLVWATVEHALRDLRNPRQAPEAAAYLLEMLPMLAAKLDGEALEAVIQHWQTVTYSRTESARRATAEDGRGARLVKLHL
jgi:ppGpp synthetase/RelA/SpoT-type nucleotidyltranferase